MHGLIVATAVALALWLTVCAAARPGRWRCECGARFECSQQLDLHQLDHHMPTPEEVVGGHIRRGHFASVPGALAYWRRVRTPKKETA